MDVLVNPLPNHRRMSRKIRTADTNRGSLTSVNRPFDKLREIVHDDSILNNIKEVIVEAEETREKKFETIVNKY
jgi:hypothetical protein